VIRPDTAIEVRVGDYVAPTTGDPAIAQWQTRTYSWTGKGFRQAAGHTSFPPNPRLTDVSVTASDLVLYSPQGRAPRGALRVTVALNRPVAPRQMSLVVFLPANLVVDESSTPGYGASERSTAGTRSPRRSRRRRRASPARS